MENYEFQAVRPKLKVGFNCVAMNISAILEYKQMLSLALAYTNFDMIYNPDTFTKYIDFQKPESYISKSNDLLICKSTNAVLHNDYINYIQKVRDEFNLFKINEISFDASNDIDKLKEIYLDKDNPVIFTCDHYYMYDDYRKSTGDVLHYHSENHAAVLVGIEDESCYIIDKFFSFAGKASMENFRNSILSEHICNKYYWTVDATKYNELNEEERIRRLLKQNIDITLKDEVNINGTRYFKNIKALNCFIRDFDGFIDEFMNSKGKYAPQFMVDLLKQIILQRVSYNSLLNYINEFIIIDELKDMKVLAEEIMKLWLRIDYMCDKCYLSGNTLIDYKERLLEVFNQICNKENLMLNYLNEIKDKI